MFVSLNNCRENLQLYFFNDKELPKGNILERLVNLTLQLFSNPKGNSAYKNIFDMLNENNLSTNANTHTSDTSAPRNEQPTVITLQDLFTRHQSKLLTITTTRHYCYMRFKTQEGVFFHAKGKVLLDAFNLLLTKINA